MVLGRVEYFEQGGRWVALPAARDLVDLVEEDDRVHGPGFDQRPDESSRPGPHVGPAVATDLGLVADAAECEANERATEGLGHRFAQGRLADPGRPDQGQDHASAPAAGAVVFHVSLRTELADGQVLDQAILYIVEAGVVGVEYAAGLGEVEALLGALGPRQLKDGVEPGADPIGLGRLGTRPLQAFDLAADGLGRRLVDQR